MHLVRDIESSIEIIGRGLVKERVLRGLALNPFPGLHPTKSASQDVGSREPMDG